MGLAQLLQITEYQENVIEGIIAYDNFSRNRKLSIILFFVNFVFLFIDYNNWARGLWIINEAYNYLFYAHVVLGLVTLWFILASYSIIGYTVNQITLSHKLYPIIFAFLILGITVVISGWISQGKSTIYTIACFTIAVMFNYKPKVLALLYGLSYVAFMILLHISQNDPYIRLGYYMDASLVVIISYFLSTVLYKFKQKELQHKFNLEDLVTERTKELQAANDLLSQEISERKRAENEMARLDRLHLVGSMAAGIGHEVRNPMTTVRGYLQLLGSKEEFSNYNGQFALMIDELDRANSIITEFLSLAKDRVVELKVQSIKEIVENIFPLLQADGLVTDKYIQVELEEVSKIPLDKKEINQLILNLVHNASQAMSPGGTMRIRTFMDKEQIVLSVKDDGIGIAPEVLGKIGTPFFTTKDSGTGLGLAVCYSIAARHNAKIDIETGSTGTTFFVRFKSD